MSWMRRGGEEAYLKRIGERPAYRRAMAKGDPENGSSAGLRYKGTTRFGHGAVLMPPGKGGGERRPKNIR